MAGRENSGLHAALIIFVLITVVLSIVSYYNFRAADEAIVRAQESEKQKKDMQKRYVDMEEQTHVYKYMLGWETERTLEAIKGSVETLGDKGDIRKIWAAYDRDMKIYGEGVDTPHYRNVPEALLGALKARNETFVVANVDKLKAQDEVDKVRQAEQNATSKHDTARQTAVTDLANVKTTFDAERARLNKEKDDLKKRGDELQNKMNDLEAKYQKQVKDLQAVLKGRDDLVKQQRISLEQIQQADKFEVPDGKIMSINQRTDTVIINLGKLDGLRTQINFSVYEAVENSPTKAKKKGGIEITRIIDDHLAEARIINSELANPILPGDWIYSPIWHIDGQLHFAITGWIDMDSDGENDRDTLINLIQINNGIVDQWQKDDGSIVGTMSLRTRYLIDVDDKEMPERAGNAIRQNRNTMITKASEFGVRRVYVKELLDYMGWKGGEKTTRIGSGAPATDPKKKLEPNSEFKTRQPPTK